MPLHVGSFLGEWWLPSKRKARVPGVLHISESGDLRLETVGRFELGDPLTTELRTHPVVHGLASTDEFTLIDVIPSSDYRPGACLIGAILRREQLSVRRLRVGFREMSRFTGISGLRRVHSGDGVTDTWTRPEPRRTRVGEGAHVELTFSWVGSPNRERLTIDETGYFEVQLDAPLDIDLFFHQYIGPLRQLMTLAFSESVAPSVVEVFMPRVTFRAGRKVFEEPLEWIRPMVHFLDPTSEARRPIFSLVDLPAGFEGTLPRWFEMARKLEPALQIYFGAHYGRPAFRDDELMLFLLAAESYHRLSDLAQTTSDKKEITRWQAVLSKAPDGLRDWLGKRIERSLERRLFERLADIAKRPGPFGQKLAQRIPGFPGTLTTWRNRLVHYDPNDDSSRLTGGQMAYACFVLRCLITSCLLHDMGVEESNIEALVGRSYIGRYAMEWNPRVSDSTTPD
jgi:hypothetical protein